MGGAPASLDFPSDYFFGESNRIHQQSWLYADQWDRNQDKRHAAEEVVVFDLKWWHPPLPSDLDYRDLAVLIGCTSAGELCLWRHENHVESDGEEPGADSGALGVEGQPTCFRRFRELYTSPGELKQDETQQTRQAKPICRWKLSTGVLYRILLTNRHLILAGDEGVLLLDWFHPNFLDPLLHQLTASIKAADRQLFPCLQPPSLIARYLGHPSPYERNVEVNDVKQSIDRSTESTSAGRSPLFLYGAGMSGYKWSMETTQIISTFEPSPCRHRTRKPVSSSYLQTLHLCSHTQSLLTGSSDGYVAYFIVLLLICTSLSNCSSSCQESGNLGCEDRQIDRLLDPPGVAQ
jgi:hypothetical protein